MKLLFCPTNIKTDAAPLVQELRTNKIREYLSNELKNFLKANEIKQNNSVKYCPASKRKAERLNRTLEKKPIACL